MAKKILLTGASGGFGKLTTLTLLARGNQVAATMRHVNGRNQGVADELRSAGADVFEIDVTDDASVEAGVNEALRDLGGLDVLINNAGVGVLGMQEFFTPEDFQRVFDINVFGVQRMNRAVIPHFRTKQDGLIIYTSSLLGRIALPFYGAYQASKWALEAMAENYRVELSGFGIENCIIEPGGYPTTFSDNLMRPSDMSREASYGAFGEAPEKTLANFEQVLENSPHQDPQKVAEAFADLVEKPKGEKPFRMPVDFIGMSDPIHAYNDYLEKIMTGLYTNFGMQGMLRVKR
jgi:NAD(P)-dependent dehydrogenase (short-subunit alcohol dehydrogenase family)